MAIVKWQFDDPVTSATYVFDVNPAPSSSAEVEYVKNIQYSVTADADGQTLLYEGRRQVQKLEWEGNVFTQEEHEAFVEWWEKQYQIDVTDDRSRTRRVYIEAYRPKRKASILYPDKRTYTATAVVVGT